MGITIVHNGRIVDKPIEEDIMRVDSSPVPNTASIQKGLSDSLGTLRNIANTQTDEVNAVLSKQYRDATEYGKATNLVQTTSITGAKMWQVTRDQ